MGATKDYVVSIKEIKEAQERIKPYARHTPLLDCAWNMKEVGCSLYLKPEMLQYVGAFKLRGALNKILSLTPEEREKGIITSSSGNHAQACAYAGMILGFPVTVVIPEDAPAVKVRNARSMGANVILWDRDYFKRWEKIAEEVKEHGYIVAHPYEDPMVMAGQGTIGLEILEDLPDVETVIVPIGGGGLISGVATAIKETNPDIRVIGIQAENSPAYYNSRISGKLESVTVQPTIADGISCRQASEGPFSVMEKYVDEIICVNEDEIAEAVRYVADKAKILAEPSSVVGVAALLAGRIKVRPDEKVAAVLTAGNEDLDVYGKLFLGEKVQGV